VTLWTEKTELFMEYPALVVGKEARFAAHLTRLSDFKPCAEEAVRFRFYSGDQVVVEQTVERPASPGIYRPAITFEKPGVYELLIMIDGALDDTLRVDSIQVYSSTEAIAPGRPGAAVQLTTFLKEQQWKTDFRTIGLVNEISARRFERPAKSSPERL
jgi:hypothetical protein